MAKRSLSMKELVELHDDGRPGKRLPEYENLLERLKKLRDDPEAVYELLADWAKQNGRLADPVVRDGLMQIYSMATTKAMVSMRTRAEMQAGKAPGPGGSLGKLLGSQIHWRFREIAQSIAGMESIASDGDAGEQLWKLVLNSFQSSIAGGTDEIQRNIIGDRVLGLPREPAVDRDVAFKNLKVGTQRTSL